MPREWIDRTIAVTVLVALIVFIVTGWSLFHKVNTEVHQQCGYFYAVAASPLPANVHKLGVELVVHSRTAFTGLGCPGKLPAPTKFLTVKAAQFGIEAPK